MWAREKRDLLTWFKEADVTLVREAGRPEFMILKEPPFEFGLRTGVKALHGEKKTVEEAAPLRRTMRDTERASAVAEPLATTGKKSS